MEASASGQPQHIPYTITSQEKTQMLTPDGRFVDVWRVSFEDEHGHHAFIEVPLSEYNPAEVDRKIEAELENVVGVKTLGAEPHPENLLGPGEVEPTA